MDFGTENWLFVKTAFMQRLQYFQQSWVGVITHPYLQWITINDAFASPECSALHGKVWHYQNPALSSIIENHFKQEIKNCRCRCSVLTENGLARSGLILER